MTFPKSRLLPAGLLGSLLVVTASCGSGGNSASPDKVAAASNTVAAAATTTAAAIQPPTTSPAPAPTEAATAPAASAAATTVPPAAPAGGKVNINGASTSDLEAAFKAVGVTNPRRWAQEVDEYRPYPTDPDFAKLRQELGKYNIAPTVLELIISTLEF